MFVVPADTFDNVKGKFPIGFMIWNTDKKEVFKEAVADIYDKNAQQLESKIFYALDEKRGTINKWMAQFDYCGNKIGNLVGCPPDYQHNIQLAVLSKPQKRYCHNITTSNILNFCVYVAVRHCMEPTWLNDRDQFLYPNDGWQDDLEFQSDCLVFTLFHGQNRITSKDGVNHWIPFTEKEVEPLNSFESHFMTDYIKEHNIAFSECAQKVFDAGCELWKYYHKQPNASPNASYYDIRAYFQGIDKSGKMNKDSSDSQYMLLIANLRNAQKTLATKIANEVYKYGFLYTK